MIIYGILGVVFGILFIMCIPWLFIIFDNHEENRRLQDEMDKMKKDRYDTRRRENYS